MNRILTTLCACLLTSIAIADDRPTYPANLGHLGYSAHDVFMVSEDGKFVGTSTTAVSSGTQAAYWTQESGLTNLGLLPTGVIGGARWITDDGMVVGFSGYGSNTAGFYWTQDEGMVALPLPPLGNLHQIRDVNPVSGAVVGNTCSSAGGGTCGDLQAFYWTKAGGLVDLGSGCIALDINASDQVAGRCGASGFYWTLATGREFIDIPGEGFCRAYAINDAGQITGGCSYGKAFVWSSTEGATTWEYPGANAYGTHISNSGRVTGNASGQRAFTWTAGTGLVPLAMAGSAYEIISKVSPTGYVVFATSISGGPQINYIWSEADGFAEFLFDGNTVAIYDINDNGVAVGYAYMGTGVGFIWTPGKGFKRLNVHEDYNKWSTGQALNHRGQVGGHSCYNTQFKSECVFALWNTEPMSYGLPPVALGDLNGNGSMDLAVVMRDGIGVHVRDSETQELISSLSFGNDSAVAIASIPDVNDNGADEVAMLVTRSTGRVKVQVKDGLTDELLNSISYGTTFAAVDMAILPDSDGNGAPEILVLGKNVVGAMRTQSRDVLTRAVTSTTHWGKQVVPVSVDVLSDVSGNGVPEIAVLGTVKVSGQSRLQVRDSSNNWLIKNLYFFGSNYEPLQVLQIGDITGDGIPDIAQLARDSATGRVRVQTKSIKSGTTIFNAYTSSTDWPISIAVARDRNADTIDEIAVLTQRPDGTAKIHIRDGATGSSAGNIFAGAITQPIGMVSVSDLDNSGGPEFAVLGEDINIVKIQIKDAVTGQSVGTVAY